jgi:UDP-N-acetylglucosamine diphosphorylase/glucosamine-1-phosphate N-acetyltransferase
MSRVKAVILAAGVGGRMLPLTYTRPKAMLPIANKPILEHIIIQIAETGINEVIVIIGYHDEVIRNYFGDGGRWGVSLSYYIQRQQKGTANALELAADCFNEDLLVMNGDVIINSKELRRLETKKGNAMSIIEVEDPTDLGVVTINNDKIDQIYEKMDHPPGKMANAGIYRFTPDIKKYLTVTSLSPRGEYEITDSIKMMIEDGVEVSYIELDKWFNLSYPWSLLDVNEELLSNNKRVINGNIEAGAEVKGEVYIGKNTVIRSGSYIVGPVMIGDNCDIGPNCYIRPSTSIGNNCHIGAAVELKNSIIMNGCKIPHHNYIGDSIIGEKCNLGAGTKIANLRLDKANIKINGKDTGRRKLGAIIGDNVETGINSSINVGTLIGNNTVIGPDTLVNGVIAPNTKIY